MANPYLTSGAAMRVGQMREDGTVYIGYHRGQDWFATARDLIDFEGRRLRLCFNEAARLIHTLKAHGYEDWQIPGEDVLTEMEYAQDVGALHGTFENHGRADQTDYYISSTAHEGSPHLVWLVLFSPGSGGWCPADGPAYPIRPVRAEPRP